MVVELRGLSTAIKEGTTTAQETFFPKSVEVTKEDVDPSKDLFGNDNKDSKKK
jgi:hypothetical protein